MKPTRYGILIAFVLVVSIVFWFVRRRNDDGQAIGFRDIVKNPDLWQAQSESWDRLKQAKVEAQNWTQQQVDSFTLKYIFDDAEDKFTNGWQIAASLRPRSDATILQLLSDSSQHERLQHELVAKGRFAPTSPFSRIASLLIDEPPERTAELVAPFMKSKSTHVRQEAALLLGATNDVQAAAALKLALNDHEFEVRNYAVMGLHSNHESKKRLDHELGAALFDDLLGYLISTEKRPREMQQAADLLMAIDSMKVVAFILTDDFFRADNGALSDVIDSATTAGVLLPHAKLRQLIESVPDDPKELVVCCVIRSAMHALGLHQREDDRPLLEQFMAHREKKIAEGAAQGLCASLGLHGFKDRLIEAETNNALNERQQLYLAVNWVDIEVRNGGFSQYFFNSAGNQWREALRGLHEVGSVERLKLFQEALSLFGSDEPSTVREKRFGQLSAVESKTEKPFEGIEERYYASTENLDVLLLKYVIKHADDFR